MHYEFPEIHHLDDVSAAVRCLQQIFHSIDIWTKFAGIDCF